MSVTTENAPVQGQTTLQENRAGEGVYASLFEKINLAPASHLGDINDFLDDAALSEAPAAERLTAAMQVFMERIRQSGQRVEKLDKTLIDHHIAELDFQISRQLDAVMHHQEFQQVESLWRGLKQLVDNTDYRQNVKTENDWNGKRSTADAFPAEPAAGGRPAADQFLPLLPASGKTASWPTADGGDQPSG